MKVTVEKVPQGVRLILHSDHGLKAPTVLTLTPQQLDVVVQVLQTACKANVFKMTWEAD